VSPLKKSEEIPGSPEISRKRSQLVISDDEIGEIPGSSAMKKTKSADPAEKGKGKEPELSAKFPVTEIWRNTKS
jgi:hypothetical protein